MWSGTIATIPSNYQLCDGTNGTPDLRSRFVICAEQDVGGEAHATIEGVLKQSTTTQSHTHVHAAGGEVVNSFPVGAWENGMSSVYHYPPCFSLAYIQRMS